MSLVDVADLRVEFGRRRVPAVQNVSFRIEPGERVGLIGESGSGKSVTALALMGLLPETAHVSGSVILGGVQVVGAAEKVLAGLRGDEIGMVFQEPMTALDPTMKVGRQIGEVLKLHRRVPSGNERGQVYEMMTAVGLAEADRIADSYPHQLSGGQRQRCVLAMALINRPDLVICDEPTTALDVTVQARVLDTLAALLAERGSACLFISHDLAVVARVCSRVLVMLNGAVVEEGPAADVLTHPRHDYTRGLVATARLDRVRPGERLPVVEDYYERSRR